MVRQTAQDNLSGPQDKTNRHDGDREICGGTKGVDQEKQGVSVVSAGE